MNSNWVFNKVRHSLYIDLASEQEIALEKTGGATLPAHIRNVKRLEADVVPVENCKLDTNHPATVIPNANIKFYTFKIIPKRTNGGGHHSGSDPYPEPPKENGGVTVTIGEP